MGSCRIDEMHHVEEGHGSIPGAFGLVSRKFLPYYTTTGHAMANIVTHFEKARAIIFTLWLVPYDQVNIVVQCRSAGDIRQQEDDEQY